MMVSDEKLSAYLDGELEPAVRAEVERALAEDAGLAARLEALAEANSAFLSAAAAIDEKPLPASLVRLLKDAEPERAENVVAMAGFARRRLTIWQTALAAGLALLVGFGAAQTFRMNADSTALPSNGVIARNSPLDSALSGGLSTVAADLGGGRVIQPRLSFKSKTGAYCRQFDISGKDGVMSGLACHENQHWRLRAASFSDKPMGGAGDGYSTASGPGYPVLDPLIDKMLVGAPLGRAEEQILIARRWTAE